MEASFGWWQWILIIVGSSVAGILAGLGVAGAIQKLQKKSWQSGLARLDKVQVYPAAQGQILPTVGATGEPAKFAGLHSERSTAMHGTGEKPAEKKKSDAVEQYLKNRNVPPAKATPVKKSAPPPPKIEPIKKSPAPPPKMEPIASRPPPAPPKTEPFRPTPAPAPRVEPVAVRKSDLVREVEANLANAVTASSGKLSAFQSGAFDSSRSRLTSVSGDTLDALTEAYTDIRLANTLVWLSKDLGRQSSEMEGGYLRLCGKIAERLQRVLPELLRAGV